MNREYHRWYSRRLERNMELLVFGHAGAKVLVFPTGAGRFYEYEDRRLVESLGYKIAAGQLQLYCVDSVDRESFYCALLHPAERIRRHQAYEEYILNEVMPLMTMKNPHPCTIAHGCGLGAFHAVNIALRHPHLFQKVAAFSGRYDLTLRTQYFRDLLDGYRDDLVYFHTPTQYLANLECPQRLAALRQMDIVLVIGTRDPFLDNNRYLSRLLRGKGVTHYLHEWDGSAHHGRDWQRMAWLYV